MTRIRFNTNLLNSGWIACSLHVLFLKGFYKMNCRHHVNQASISSTFLAERVFIPLPPLQEQKKIVEEIERLFSIADQTEYAIEKSLVHAERLRQSILKQAFEGKLVPQDPTDEPASVLLERIKAEKAKHEDKKKNKEYEYRDRSKIQKRRDKQYMMDSRQTRLM
jgi:type I restriction enzyme S subunit